MFRKGEQMEIISLMDYNPNQSDSPYCMKYFKALIDSMYKNMGMRLVIELEGLEGIIEDGILFHTDFTGEVWK